MYEVVLYTLLGIIIIDEIISVYFVENYILRLNILNKKIKNLENTLTF